MVSKGKSKLVSLLAVLLAVVMGGVGVVPVAAFADPTGTAVAQRAKAGNLVIFKYDAETGENAPQGGAAWGGSHQLGMDADDSAGEFTITNLSSKAVEFYDDYGHTHTYNPGESWTIKTHKLTADKTYTMPKLDANGNPVTENGKTVMVSTTIKAGAIVADTATGSLPYGKYHVQETKAPSGYGLASDQKLLTNRYIKNILDDAKRTWVTKGYDFTISSNGQTVVYGGHKEANANGATVYSGGSNKETAHDGTPGCYNPLWRAGIGIVKRDHDLRAATAQGNATLTKAVFKIYNANAYSVKVLDHFDGKDQGVVASPENGNDADKNGMVAPNGLVATVISGDDGQAQTFMDALPAGWYRVEEVTAPWGYDLETGWSAYVQISDDDFDNLVITDCDDQVKRSDITFVKQDAYTKDKVSGDGTFQNAEYDIYYKNGKNHATADSDPVVIYRADNPNYDKNVTDATDYRGSKYVDVSDNVYTQNQNGDYIRVVREGGFVARVRTDANGRVTMPKLPTGDYYVVEHKAPTGYDLNSENTEFTVDASGKAQTITMKDTPSDSMTIDVSKIDADTGLATPAGGATFDGAVFGLYNTSANPVAYDVNGDGKISTSEIFKPSDTTPIATATVKATRDAKGNVTGYAPARFNHVFYGTYKIREIKAPTGYVRRTDAIEVVAHEKDKTYPVNWEEQVIREDLTFSKISNDTQKPMANVAFLLTSDTTGESHLLVTDEDGMVNTAAYLASDIYDYVDNDKLPSEAGDSNIWRLHSYNTNGADGAYKADTGTVDSSADGFGFDQGYWFYGVKAGTDTSKMSTNDYRSALPYDTYTLTEIRTDANKGVKLVSRKIYINRANNDTEDLGTITNSTYVSSANTVPPCGSDLEVHKSSSVPVSTTMKSGQTVIYTFDYENTSAKSIASARIRDYVPEGLKFVSASNGGVYVDGDKPYVEWTTDAIAVGAKGKVTVTFKVTNQADPVIDNQGYFETESKKLTAGDKKLPEPTNTTNIVRNSTDGTTPESALSGKKTVDVAAGKKVHVGDVLTYSIKVTNEGGKDAKNVAIYDEAPNGTELVNKTNAAGYEVVDASDGAFKTGNGLGWKFAHLAPGESQTVWYKVKVTSSSYDVISNQAAFGFACGDPSKGLCSSTNIVSRELERTPAVTAELSSDAGAEVTRGQIVTYTLKMTNSGNGNIASFNVWDVIPEGMQYVKGSASDGAVEPTDVDPFVHWVIPSLTHDGGTATVSFKARVTDDAKLGSTVDNIAVIGGKAAAKTADKTTLTSAAEQAASNKVTAKVVDALGDGFDIEKTQNADQYVSAGDEVTYTIKWTNNSDREVHGFAVRDVVPEGTTFVPGSVVVTGADGKTSTAVKSELADAAGSQGGSAVSPVKRPVVWSDEINLTTTDPGAIYDAVVSDPSKQSIENWETVKTQIAKAKDGDTIYFTEKNDGWYDLKWQGTVHDKGQICLRFCIFVPSLQDSENYAPANGIYGSYDKSSNAVYAMQDTIKPGETGSVSFKVKVNDDIADNAVIKNSFTYDANVYLPSADDFSHKGNEVSTTAGAPELEGTKTVTPEGVIAVGDTLTYNVAITNNGSAAAHNVAIFDPVMHDLKGVAIVPQSVKVAGGENARIAGDVNAGSTAVAAMADALAPGETMTLTFDVQVVDMDLNDKVSNYATFDKDVTEVPISDLAHKTDTVENTVGTVNLSLEKSATPDAGSTVSAGDTITYKLKLTNSSDVKATNVAIYDAVPDHAKLQTKSVKGLKVSADGTYLYASGITLAAHKSAEFSFAVTVDGNLNVGSAVSNRATAGVTTGDPTGPLAFSSNEVTHEVAKPVVNLTKSADKPGAVAPGDEITYTIHASNDGDVIAKGVGVYDAIPAGTEFVSATGDGLVVPGSEAEDFDASAVKHVSWFVGDIAAGEAHDMTVTVKVANDATGSVTNTSSWGFGLTEAPDKAQPSGNSNDVTNVIETKPSVSLTKSASVVDGSEVAAGDIITYKIVAKNSGSTVARDVAVFDAIPSGAELVSGSATGMGANEGDGYVAWMLGDMAAGQSETLTFQVKVTANSGVLNNVASWAHNVKEVPTEALTEGISNPIEFLAGSADLSVVKSVSPSGAGAVSVGDTLTYTVKATNNGTTVARGLAIHDVIPEGTTYVAGSLKASVANEGDGYVSGWLGNVKPGASASMTYQVKVTDPKASLISSTASWDTGIADAPKDALANQTNTVRTLVGTPKVSVIVSQDPVDGDRVTPGDTIHYTVTATNIGDVAASGLALYDAIPEGATYVADSLKASDVTVNAVTGKVEGGSESSATVGEGTNVTQGFSALVDTLESGDSVSFEFDVKVNSGFVGVVTNEPTYQLGQATVPESKLALHANDVDALSQQPTLTITKGQTPTSGSYVAPGDTITYTVTVKNTGKVHANDVGMYDVVPEGTTYVPDSLSITQGTVKLDESNGLITGLPGTLEKGESVTFTFKATVNMDKTGVIHNRAMWVSPASAVNVVSTSEESEDAVKTPSMTLPGLLSRMISPAFALDVTDIINPGKGSASGISEDSGQPKSDESGKTTGESGTKTDEGTKTDTPKTDEGTKTDKPKTDGGTGSSTTIVDGKTSGATDTDKGGTNGADTKVTQSDKSADGDDSNETDATVVKPTLTIIKSADVADGDYVREGDAITFTIDVTNSGLVNANHAVIVDVLPEGLEYVENSLKAEGLEARFEDGSVVATGDMKPGDKATITFTAKAAEGTDGKALVNGTKWGQSETGAVPEDTKPGNNEVTINIGTPNLTLSKSASVADGSYVKKGDEITYTLSAANEGSRDAADVEISDTLPEGLEFVFGDDAIKADGNKLTVSVGDMAVGDKAEYQFVAKVTADAGTKLTNGAAITGKKLDSVNSNTVAVVVGSPAITATKTVDAQGHVQPGDELTYTVTLANAGTVSGHAAVSDALPEGLEFVSGDEGITADGAKLAFEADVAAGETKTFTYKVKVSDNTEGKTLTNGVSVSVDGSDAKDATPVDVTVGKPDVVVTKTSDPESGAMVKPGDEITYTIKAVNDGDARATNMVITDVLPEGVAFESAVDADGTEAAYDEETRTITYEVGTLEAGASAKDLTIKVTVDGKAQTVTNVAKATYQGTAESNSTTVNVDTFAGTLSKTQALADGEATTDDLKLTQGDIVTYVVTFENTSAFDESGIVLSDVVPAQMTLVDGSIKADVDGTAVNATAGTAEVEPAAEPEKETTVAPEGESEGETTVETEGTAEVEESTVETEVTTENVVKTDAIVVPAGKKATLTFQVKATEVTSEEDAVVNVATYIDEAGHTGQSNIVSATIAAPAVVDDTTKVSINKKADAESVAPGQEATFTIVVKNDGTVDAKNLVVSELGGEGLTIKSMTEVAAGAETGSALPDVLQGSFVDQTNPYAVLIDADRVTIAAKGDDGAYKAVWIGHAKDVKETEESVTFTGVYDGTESQDAEASIEFTFDCANKTLGFTYAKAGLSALASDEEISLTEDAKETTEVAEKATEGTEETTEPAEKAAESAEGKTEKAAEAEGTEVAETEQVEASEKPEDKVAATKTVPVLAAGQTKTYKVVAETKGAEGAKLTNTAKVAGDNFDGSTSEASVSLVTKKDATEMPLMGEAVTGLVLIAGGITGLAAGLVNRKRHEK